MTYRIKYLDSVDTETHVYIATERVRPLAGVLRDWKTGGGKGKEHWIGWGIRSIAVRPSSISLDRLRFPRLHDKIG